MKLLDRIFTQPVEASSRVQQVNIAQTVELDVAVYSIVCDMTTGVIWRLGISGGDNFQLPYRHKTSIVCNWLKHLLNNFLFISLVL